MPLALTVDKQHDLGDVLLVRGTLVASGSYSTGGDTVDFTGKVNSTQPPLYVEVHGQAGFVYSFDIGTTIANGKMLVFVNTAGGVNTALGEHTAVAYVAGVTGDDIRFVALFKKFV